MLHTQLVAFVLAATALAVSGCGGSSKTDSTSTAATTAAASTTNTTNTTSVQSGKPATGKTLTHAELVAAGDAICLRLNNQLNATPIRSTREFATVLPQAAAYERIAATEMSKLVPPASVESDWERIIAAAHKWSEASLKLGEYVRTSSISAANTTPVARIGKVAHEELATIARAIGFKECSVI